jgi:hypothetical protein
VFLNTSPRAGANVLKGKTGQGTTTFHCFALPLQSTVLVVSSLAARTFTDAVSATQPCTALVLTREG